MDGEGPRKPGQPHGVLTPRSTAAQACRLATEVLWSLWQSWVASEGDWSPHATLRKWRTSLCHRGSKAFPRTCRRKEHQGPGPEDWDPLPQRSRALGWGENARRGRGCLLWPRRQRRGGSEGLGSGPMLASADWRLLGPTSPSAANFRDPVISRQTQREQLGHRSCSFSQNRTKLAPDFSGTQFSLQILVLQALG